MTWHLTMPPRAKFVAAIAVHPMVWAEPGDGVNFRVIAEDNGRTIELLSRHVDPVHAPADRRWIPVELDLSSFAGRSIDLALMTDPSAPGVPPEAANDFALWAEPRID
jgi:hypothetical protein